MEPAPYQRILENLHTAVILADGDLRVRCLNPAGEMLLALSSRQVAGAPLRELLPDNEPLLESMRHALADRHPFTMHGHRLTDATGQTHTVDVTVTPVTHEGITDVLVEFMPIDRLLRMAREETLQDRQSVSRQVVRGLAHEIKNPLGGLRGAAQLLERELPGRELREYTRIIIHEADRLRALVERMMGPTQPPALKPVNIHTILEHVRALTFAEHPSGITLRRDYDPSLPDMLGDAEQLIQAVLNIVRNAVQALGGRGTIVLRTRIERNYTLGNRRHRLVLRADIQDDGPGVAEDLLPRIFFPMVTGRAEGTGLGLSIAQDIVQRHGGVIECQSAPGRTVFSLYLPLET